MDDKEIAQELLRTAQLLISGIPSAVAKKNLAKAYALKIESAKSKAPMRHQQRFHDRFQKLYDKLSSKHPDVDMNSAGFWGSLERHAKKWWDSRGMKGPSVDW